MHLFVVFIIRLVLFHLRICDNLKNFTFEELNHFLFSIFRNSFVTPGLFWVIVLIAFTFVHFLSCHINMMAGLKPTNWCHLDLHYKHDSQLEIIYIYIHTHIFINMICIYIYINTHIYINIYTNIYDIYIHIHIYTYTYIFIYYMYIYIHIYIYTHIYI